MKTISEVVRTYRTRHDASLRAFADMLSGNAPQSVTHQTVSNWEKGTYLPNHMYLLTLATSHDDWRREFALDCLAVMKPDFYTPNQPVTRITQSNQQ